MRILITAGPTKEFIDPVRFISNSSTGFFGYEIARAARKKGHKVTLVSGPTHLIPPKDVKFISVMTALEMKSAVERIFPSTDCLVMTAAVADYRPERFFPDKIKKEGKDIFIKFKKNPDILFEAGRKKKGRILAGFAVETKDSIKNAKEKIERKNLDFIVTAALSERRSPFGDQKANFIVIDKNGAIERIFGRKAALSSIIVDKIEKIWYDYKRGKKA
ncbi:MAG: phosphopantothenoylcysteine decarboxylase [Candidatus Omnitrophota bacterium]